MGDTVVMTNSLASRCAEGAGTKLVAVRVDMMTHACEPCTCAAEGRGLLPSSKATQALEWVQPEESHREDLDETQQKHWKWGKGVCGFCSWSLSEDGVQREGNGAAA